MLSPVISFGLWLWAFVDYLQPFHEESDSINRIGEALQTALALPGVLLMGFVSLWLLVSEISSLAKWNRHATISASLIALSILLFIFLLEELEFIDLPLLNLGPDTLICEGEFYILEAEHRWSKQVFTTSNSPPKAGMASIRPRACTPGRSSIAGSQ